MVLRRAIGILRIGQMRRPPVRRGDTAPCRTTGVTVHSHVRCKERVLPPDKVDVVTKVDTPLAGGARAGAGGGHLATQGYLAHREGAAVDILDMYGPVTIDILLNGTCLR